MIRIIDESTGEVKEIRTDHFQTQCKLCEEIILETCKQNNECKIVIEYDNKFVYEALQFLSVLKNVRFVYNLFDESKYLVLGNGHVIADFGIISEENAIEKFKLAKKSGNRIQLVKVICL